jgi:hypothetical protein
MRASASHFFSGPQYTRSASQSSVRPPAKPKVLKPIDSSATFPDSTIRSAQERLLPYFCLMGQSSRRALSRLALSGQLFRGLEALLTEPRRRDRR